VNITFIGGGNMAEALIGGLLGKGFKTPELHVVEINPEQRRKLAAKYGVGCHATAAEALRPGDIIVLAVKPQQMRAAVSGLALEKDANLVISIAAGITLDALSKWLYGHLRLIRAMPNTPALIGEGITGLYAMPQQVTPEDIRHAETILGAVGATVWIADAGLMDAVTAVSGSGPAYVFLFMEALEQAGRELGLSAETARKLALQTFTGAAKLAASSPEPLSVLRERVTSKGGTTEAALNSMDRDEVKNAIIRAIRAAEARGRELGEQLGEQPGQEPGQEAGRD